MSFTKNMRSKVTADCFVKEVEDVFTDQECADLIDFSEKKGYESKQKNKFGETVDNPCIRSDDHVSIVNAALVKKIQARIQPLLPGSIHDKPFRQLQNRLKFNRYSTGQDFRPHSDTPLVKNKSQSLLTVMIYLNSGFKGGNTRFFNVDNMLHFDVVPKTGKVLMFDQDLYHSGLKVTSGVKYCLRLDVMYASDDASPNTSRRELKPSNWKRRAVSGKFTHGRRD